MRVITILILLFLSCQNEEQRISVSGRSAVSNVSTYPPVHIRSQRGNELLVGFDNYLELFMDSSQFDSVTVQCLGCELQEIREVGTYIRPTEQAKVSLKTTLYKHGKANEYLETFRTRYLPNPIPKVGQVSQGTIRAGELRAQQGLRAPIENESICAKYKLLSYSVTVTREYAANRTCLNDGARFGDDCRKLIDSVLPGDYVIFNDIVARGLAGKSRRLNSFALLVN